MKTPAQSAVILFDGECPLCRKSVHFLSRLDWLGRLRFQNCRDESGIPPNQAGLTSDRMLAEMHVLLPGHARAISGYPAIRWILGRIPLGWPIFPLHFLPGFPALGQRLYLWIARNRFRLLPCRHGVCSIPTKQNP